MKKTRRRTTPRSQPSLGGNSSEIGGTIGSRAGVLPCEVRALMPSVGMRRTTRVFGARVLRSGRRLWTPGEEVKRAKHGNEWIELLDNVGRDGGGGGGATKYKENGWLKKDSAPKQDTNQETDIDVETKAMAEPETPIINPNSNSFRRWGTVYTRKRKRHESGKGDTVTEGKRFGKHFVRKKRVRAAYAKDSDKSEEGQISTGIVIVNTSCGSSYWVSCLLNCVLRYLRKSTISLQQIFGFINSKPLRDVSSLHGILLLQVLFCHYCFTRHSFARLLWLLGLSLYFFPHFFVFFVLIFVRFTNLVVIYVSATSGSDSQKNKHGSLLYCWWHMLDSCFYAGFFYSPVLFYVPALKHASQIYSHVLCIGHVFYSYG